MSNNGSKERVRVALNQGRDNGKEAGGRKERCPGDQGDGGEGMRSREKCEVLTLDQSAVTFPTLSVVCPRNESNGFPNLMLIPLQK
jgi:hypothetical protein